MVDVPAVVAVWPAVESAITNRCDVVGNEIGAELVPLVDRDPESARLRFPGETDGIAKTAREYAMGAGSAIDFPDRCATVFVQDTVLGGVAV